ncbi:MAG: 23S rRNA pseudouridine(2604) synthase RluF [Bacteroidetes bacterium]|nr:23S rRNA pseudouridine(2604) synthase RluF [Bacteroidota bacterium]
MNQELPPPNTIRLNKAISDTGFCSRREADKFIEQGRVTVNERLGSLGDRVSLDDVLEIDGKRLKRPEKIIYIAFNKPVGVTCTTEPQIEKNIISFINHPQRIFPIGRLDKASEGLIFLTSDGNIVNKILRAGNQHEKEYLVTVNKPITPEFIFRMGNGIPVLDTVTDKCMVEKIGHKVFRIILTQGLNRQIRRMCDYLEYEVVSLKRTRIMNIKLDRLAIGQWRNFTSAELVEINDLIASSSKTEEASFKESSIKPK